MAEHGDEKDVRGWTHEEAKRRTLVERLHERCALYGGAICPDKPDLAHEDWCERCLAAEALTRVTPPEDNRPKRVRPCVCKPGEPLLDCAGGDPRAWLCHRPLRPAVAPTPAASGTETEETGA